MRRDEFDLRPGIVFLSVVLLARAPQARADGAFGTGPQITVIPAAAFRPESSSLTWSTDHGVRIKPLFDTTCPFVAPVQLPNGAVVERHRPARRRLRSGPSMSRLWFFGYAHPMSGSPSVTYDPGYLLARDDERIAGSRRSSP